jgi:proline iminopeptidase
VLAYYKRYVCRLDPWPDALERASQGMGHDVYATMWGPSEFAATGTLKDYDRTPRLHEIGLPTLFLCGRYDEATPEATKWYQSLVPGAEMIVFEHSAHMPHLEETERYLGVVRDFLSRVEKKRAR